MPRVIGPSQSGPSLGQVIADIAQSTWGDTLTPALKREKLYGMQRENVETENAMRMLAAPNTDVNSLIAAGFGAGIDQTDLAAAVMTKFAHQFGAKDPRVTNAWVGAGKPYGQSPMGFGEYMANQRNMLGMRLAEDRYQFNNTPVEALVGGQPAFVPRAGAFAGGVAPILSEAEQRGTLLGQNFDNLDALSPAQQEVLGADVNDPSATYQQYYDLATNVGMPAEQASEFALSQAAKRGKGMSVTAPDGTTIEMGGVPGLERPVRSALQKQDISNQKFKGLVEYTKNLLNEGGAQNVGITGRLKGMAQDVGQLADNLAAGMGYNGAQEAVGAMARQASAQGVSPQTIRNLFTFDPNLPKIQTAYQMLVFSGAEALAGQEGRSVTDRDIQRFQAALGNPGDIFANPASLGAKLDAAMDILGLNQRVTDQYLGRGPAGAGAPPPPAAAPAARPRAVNPQTGEVLEFDGTQWVPAQ
ncbi:hypothetical protein [Rhodoligotrophos defluvii]|uniref:hypothetical protein n=1 Tax=Rhodoligotrophos defluvii TaxID=2561934 RepID=UPI0010C9B115|nr:hypothetical protein [Rhodoligotrophos defluvii]